MRMLIAVTQVTEDLRVSLTPRAAEIARAARALLEEEGVEALSMRNIGARLGIRAASLYEHFPDKRAVENAIIAATMWEQGDYISAEVADSDDPALLTIARTFREFGLAHPALYQLVMSRDLDRGAPDVAAAEQHAGEALRQTAGPGNSEFALAFWAFCHGALDLEINRRFPPGFDVELVWQIGVGAIAQHLDDVHASG